MPLSGVPSILMVKVVVRLLLPAPIFQDECRYGRALQARDDWRSHIAR